MTSYLKSVILKTFEKFNVASVDGPQFGICPLMSSAHLSKKKTLLTKNIYLNSQALIFFRFLLSLGI